MSTDPVLITGMGIVSAIGTGVAKFSEALHEGRCGIQREGAVAGAPVRGFGFPDAIASVATESMQRLAIRTAGRSPLGVRAAVAAGLEAWAQSGLIEVPVPVGRVGIVVGGNNVTDATSFQMTARYADNPVAVPGRFALHMQDTDQVATLSHVLGIRGEGYTVGGASASGNVALIHGARMVQSGAADACLVVGALSELSPVQVQAYQAMGAMADPAAEPEDAVLCRPFDRAHSGFVAGQASAAVLLESPESARRRGVPALARLAGYAMTLAGTSLPDPSEEAEVAVMAKALERANASPDRVDYVNTHGTASPLGDKVEAQALLRLLGAGSDTWINATKALTGHCLCSAGVLEAVATIAQMSSGFVHPNIHLLEPITNELRFAGPKAEPARIDLAISNSFGFGGLHTAIVITAEGV